MRLLGIKAFLCPSFLDYRKQDSFSLQDTQFQGAGSNRSSLGKGRVVETREGTVKRNNNAGLGQGPATKNTRNYVFKLYKMSAFFIPEKRPPEATLKEPEKVIKIT